MFEHRRTTEQPKRTFAAFRLGTLALLTFGLMACSNVPQPPNAAAPAGAGVQPQMLICDPSDPATCDPQPEPDPIPAPDPAPAPNVMPGAPQVTPEMALALQQAGLATDPYAVGQTYMTSCNVALYTRGSDSTTCTLTGPQNTTLRSDGSNYQAVRVNLTSQHNCRYSTVILPSGGRVQSRVEVDSIYSRAIDAALKVSNFSLAAKLGQMRDYHLNVVDFNSPTAGVQLTFYAKSDSFWKGGRGGNCNGTVQADFVYH